MRRITTFLLLLSATRAGWAAPCPPPFLVCPLPTGVPCGTAITFTPPTAVDLCTGTAAAVTALSTTTNGTCPQFIARVWRATDSQGQTSTCTQTVAIVDTVTPTFCADFPAGNLVPNPSFEINTACPSNFSGQIILATPWTGANGGSSDYYHTCALHPDLDVPNNVAGNQAPFAGQAYAGIHATDTAESVAPSPYREYIQAQLTASLVLGRTYTVSFRVSLADTSRRAVDNLGAHLSIPPLSIPTSNAIPVIPQVRNPAGSFLTDKTGWTLIQGEFIAAGGERYVTIGNFYDNTNTPILAVSGNRNWGYYYIDDVQVVEICCPHRTVECRNPLTFEPPVARDACSGTNVTVTLLTGSVVSNTPCARVHRLVWQALDRCSNSTTCTQLVTVVDTMAPVVNCPQRITVATCSNSATVFFKATANDACDTNALVNCTPPSGSLFLLGTTFVTCTAVDDCGNTNRCPFPVEVLPGTNFWEMFPGGFADCYTLPNETTYRSACLDTAYPGTWKDFDDDAVDSKFGFTWELPPGTYLDGWLHTWMSDSGCSGGSEDDTISLGLVGCGPTPPPTWIWSRPLGPSGPDPGLQSNLWCNIPVCDRLFSLHLSALTNFPSGEANIIFQINAALRLDLMVQDDTRVDSARLLLQRCPPQDLVGGLATVLTGASLVYGPGSWTLARDATTNFSASFDLGLADGVRLTFEKLSFAGDCCNGLIRLGTKKQPHQNEEELFQLAAFGTDLVRFQLGQTPPGVTQVQTRTLSNGVVVANNTLPAMPGVELARFPASASILQAGASRRGNVFVTLSDGAGATIIHEARLVASSAVLSALPRLRPLSLAADGFASITVGPPELAIVDPAGGDGWIGKNDRNDWVRCVSGDALARAGNGQLALSALQAGRSAPMGFVASLAGGASNEFRAMIESSFGQFSPVPGDASLRFDLTAQGVSGQPDDVIRVSFLREQDSFWGVSGAPAPLRRVEIWNSNDVRVVEVSNPATVSVSKLPPVYWPSTGWFIEADTCHRFIWTCPATVRINGTSYEATEMRFLTGGGGNGARTLKQVRVETIGAESLVLSRIDPGPMRYSLGTPVVNGGGLTLRGNTLGAVFLRGPTLNGPWAAEFSPSGQLHTDKLRITNAPQMFYRIKGR